MAGTEAPATLRSEERSPRVQTSARKSGHEGPRKQHDYLKQKEKGVEVRDNPPELGAREPCVATERGPRRRRGEGAYGKS